MLDENDDFEPDVHTGRLGRCTVEILDDRASVNLTVRGLKFVLQNFAPCWHMGIHGWRVKKRRAMYFDAGGWRLSVQWTGKEGVR